MSVAAWDGFLNDQSNWPAASRIGNATGATTARDTLGDKTFVIHSFPTRRSSDLIGRASCRERV